MPKTTMPRVCFNSKKNNNPAYLPKDSRAFKMAELACVKLSKERSEMQSQNLKSFFEKMPDPRQIMDDSTVTVDTEIAPAIPVPVALDVEEHAEPTQTSRSETTTNNLLYSTLHQTMRINLDVSVNATSSIASSAVVNVTSENRKE